MGERFDPERVCRLGVRWVLRKDSVMGQCVPNRKGVLSWSGLGTGWVGCGAAQRGRCACSGWASAMLTDEEDAQGKGTVFIRVLWVFQASGACRG